MDYVFPLKALADETRLRLFAVLTRHELNVNELTALFAMGQSRISRHLRILSDAGLIVLRRQGQWSFYRRNRSDAGLLGMTDGIMAWLETWPDLVEDLAGAASLIAARNQESRRFFATVAGKNWTAMKNELDGGADLDGRIVDWLENKGTVADIGCGMGDLLLRLAGICRHVIGVDHAPAMLEQLQARLRDNQASVDLRIGDAAHLPLGDGEADVMILNMVLHHLPQPDSVFRELTRVTRGGGQLLVAELDSHSQDNLARRFGDVWHGFAGSDLIEWLKQAGWTPTRHECLPIGLGLKAHLISAKKN